MRAHPSPLAAAVVAAGALLSIATSPPPTYSVADETEVGPVHLDADTLVYVAGHVEASDKLEQISDGWVTLTFALEGENAEARSGELQLWRVYGPFDGTLPADAELMSVYTVRGRAGDEPEPVYATLGAQLDASEDADFGYILALDGGAAVGGVLTLHASVSLDDPPPQGARITVESDTLEVTP